MKAKFIMIIDYDGKKADIHEIAYHILNDISSVVNDDVFIKSIEIDEYEHIKQA